MNEGFESPSTGIWAKFKHVFSHAGTAIDRAVGYLPDPIERVVRKHKWKFSIGIVIVALLTFGYIQITTEPEPEILTAAVVRGDILQKVEAVGSVTSEKDLKLQFPVSGVVAEVLVKEGDSVEAGQRLAALRADDLRANVNSAAASVAAAKSDLQEMQEGTRPEDIAIAEAEVANKRASLKAAEDKLVSSEEKLVILEREAEVNLAGYNVTARSTVSRRLSEGRTALSVVEDVFNDSDVSHAIANAGISMQRPFSDRKNEVDTRINVLMGQDRAIDDYKEALDRLRLAREVVQAAYDIVSELFEVIANVPPTPQFSKSEREERKADLSTERNALQVGLGDLDAVMKNLQDASAGYDTKIASERTTVSSLEGEILTLESSLRTQEAQLALKRAGSRPTEIDSAAARVRQAQADLQRAQADFQDTILIAPVTGTVTKVNIKTGELLSTAFQQDAAITMLGETPYRVEMYVSEVDIPKVILHQTGAIELDAFPNRPFTTKVAEIDPAASDVDGVPKYRVKMDFLETHPGFKIGMTGDAEIYTGERTDVMLIPARALVEGDKGQDIVRVIKDGKVEDRDVEAGMEGENDVEILSGLEVGEEVVVLIKN